jgi:predicted ATP-grasp superfamily ATP-dependent carboligase
MPEQYSDLIEQLDLQRSTYEGPTGVVGVLHDACNRRGIPSASLWAAVPHYVAAVPNPKAALALLRRFEGLAGIAVEASDLEEESESFEQQVSNAVSANPEIQELVDRLEREAEEQVELGENIPSGEALARDFERYLRQQGGDPGQPGGPPAP